MSRAFVIGNGPSLSNTPLDLLVGEKTYAVNSIWKIFNRTKWRPTSWVHGEGIKVGDAATRDIAQMAKTDARMWLPPGYQRYAARRDVAFGRPVIFYCQCCRRNPEPWHLDLGDYICTYGTSVHTAMQIAVMEGATEIYLVGCDLGNSHFYGDNFPDEEMALTAHKIAKECSPVPIYNATIGGSLEVYPRVDFMSLFGDKNGKEEAVHSRSEGGESNRKRAYTRRKKGDVPQGSNGEND